MGYYCRPESRSVAATMLSRIGCLLIQVWTDEQASRENNASRLREIARLAQAAANDLEPRD